jgi:hypothetical protein
MIATADGVFMTLFAVMDTIKIAHKILKQKQKYNFPRGVGAMRWHGVRSNDAPAAAAPSCPTFDISACEGRATQR